MAFENQSVPSAVNPTARRQSPTRVRRLHHFAIGTVDMERTREFYEDIVGLPHVATWREELPDPITGVRHYMHCFFQLGDGSALAFFQFAKDERRAPEKLPREVFDHHIALYLDSVEDVLAMRERLKKANRVNALIDHGYCYSLYTRDPNGLLVEFAADPKDVAQVVGTKASTARQELQAWLAGDHSVSNIHRDFEGAARPVSSMDEIVAVAIPPEHQ